jgi:hypothetical protein
VGYAGPGPTGKANDPGYGSTVEPQVDGDDQTRRSTRATAINKQRSLGIVLSRQMHRDDPGEPGTTTPHPDDLGVPINVAAPRRTGRRDLRVLNPMRSRCATRHHPLGSHGLIRLCSVSPKTLFGSATAGSPATAARTLSRGVGWTRNLGLATPLKARIDS